MVENNELEADFNAALFNYKLFFNEHKSVLQDYNRIKAKLVDKSNKIECFKVAEALTVKINIEGVLKTAAKLIRGGMTVFFDNSNIPNVVQQKKIYLLSWEERISKKGNRYIYCDSWTFDDPLETLRKEKDTLQEKLLEKNSEMHDIFNEIISMKNHLVTLRLLREYERKTHMKWETLFIIPVYVNIVDSMQDPFNMICIYKEKNTNDIIVCLVYNDNTSNRHFMIHDTKKGIKGISAIVCPKHNSDALINFQCLYNYSRKI